MGKTRIKLSLGDEFSSLNELLSSKAYRSGDEITFLTDVTLDQPVSIEKRCSIDLGGHCLFIAIPSALTIKGGVSVEIYNGDIKTLVPDQLEDAIIIQGSKTRVTFGHDLRIDTRGTAVHVRKRGCLVLSGASIRSNGDQPSVYVDDEVSSFLIQNGEVVSYQASAISIRDAGSVVVNNGKIYTEADGLAPEAAYPAIVVDGQNSSLQFNDGSIFSDKTSAVHVFASGSVQINGGEIESSSKDYPVVEVKGPNSSFKVSDGWVDSAQSFGILSYGMNAGDVHYIQVEGGHVGLGCEGPLVKVVGKGDHGVVFSGGSIRGYLDPSFIASGFSISDTPDEYGYYPIVESTEEHQDISDSSSTSVDNTVTADENDDSIFEPVFDPDLTDSTSPSKESDTILLSKNMLSVTRDIVDESSEIENLAPVPEDFETKHSNNDSEISKDNIHYILSIGSVNIKNKIYIYKTPLRKNAVIEWRGALRIVDSGYFGPNDEEFLKVSFRIPGSGKIATGYALVKDILVK